MSVHRISFNSRLWAALCIWGAVAAAIAAGDCSRAFGRERVRDRGRKDSSQDRPAKMIPAGPPQAPMASEPAPSPRDVKDSAAVSGASAGEPLAPGLVELVHGQVVQSLRNRGITNDFARFQAYAATKLDSTVGAYTGSEVTGNCRLKWYDHLLRNPSQATAEAEQFTRELHTAVRDDPSSLARILPMIAEKLDLPKRAPGPPVAVDSPEQAVDVIKQALAEAHGAYDAALAPLTKAEIQELRTNL